MGQGFCEILCLRRALGIESYVLPNVEPVELLEQEVVVMAAIGAVRRR